MRRFLFLRVRKELFTARVAVPYRGTALSEMKNIDIDEQLWAPAI